MNSIDGKIQVVSDLAAPDPRVTELRHLQAVGFLEACTPDHGALDDSGASSPAVPAAEAPAAQSTRIGATKDGRRSELSASKTGVTDLSGKYLTKKGLYRTFRQNCPSGICSGLGQYTVDGSIVTLDKFGLKGKISEDNGFHTIHWSNGSIFRQQAE